MTFPAAPVERVSLRSDPVAVVGTTTLRRMQPRTFGDDLAVAFVAGEPDALRRVFDEHQRAVFTYARRFVSDQAADVTQEVFLAAWRSRERFDPAAGSLAGWLMGIARFKVIDHVRGRYRNASVAAGDLVDLSSSGTRGPGDGTVDDGAIDDLATRLLVADVLERLDEPGCSWIRMAFLEGLSHSEIADRVGAPLGTVKSTIRRGLERIRRDLESFDAHA